MSESFDIAVVGAGAAGIAAAVGAARAGRTTILLDQRFAGGGTGGFSGLTTLCGLFDDDGEFLNEGFAREFSEALAEGRLQARLESQACQLQRARSEIGVPKRDANVMKMGRVWVLQYRPEMFRAVAANLFVSTPNLKTRWKARLAGTVVEGNRIVSLNGVRVGAVIDCSGSAEVARAIGADYLATDDTTQSPAVIFPLCHVTRELNSPVAVAQVLLPLARAGFPPLSFQTSLERDTVTVKFTGRVDQVCDVIAFLQKNVSGFENCRTPLTEFTATQRAGRMIVGQYLLTGEDVLKARKFSDAVARCAWPIEQWGTDGTPRFKYLPPGAHYEIPARVLQSAVVPNLFMAGKTISADVDAIASARVMGCCLATGAAAGVLAANYLDSATNR
ncbi:MAG: FAD-dependent oxidoreductase [Limisphaerales bacterium]